MGTDVWANGEFTIKLERLGEALPVILQGVADKYGHENIEAFTEHEEPLTDPDDDPAGYLGDLMELTFVEVDDNTGDMVFSLSEDGFRGEDDERWLFELAAPFCEGDSAIWLADGDDNKWKWAIVKGKLEEVGSDTVYGDDANAPELVGKIVEIIYPNGKPIGSPGNELGRGEYELVIDRIENLLREGGFGPQAGMNGLERLAEA